GLGGTNAFVVLQEAPRSRPRAADDGPLHLFATSAKSQVALRLSIEKYRDWLDGSDAGEASLADICFTSTLGRSHFSKRFFATARSKAELCRALDTQTSAANFARVAPPEGRRLAFVFSGQASQYPRMGAELYRDYEVFRDTINYCSE